MSDVIVIGGGASGLAAAIEAARGGCSVTVLEQKERTGKKILATGNGRCNLTNLYMDPYACYRGGNPGFTAQILEQVTVDETLDWFRDLGIPTKDRNGYVYPRSDQAAAVAEALVLEAEHLGVKILCGFRAEAIVPVSRPNFKGFQVTGSRGDAEGLPAKKAGSPFRYEGNSLILAAGSKAAPATGSDGSGYRLAESLGHEIVTPLPALVQLVCRGRVFRQLAGIRTDALVRLLLDGQETARDRGEVQLTDYGISGIPVFQVSRFASRGLHQGRLAEAVLDFLPDLAPEETVNVLFKRRERLAYRPGDTFLSGLLAKKLGCVLLSAAGISLTDPAGRISDKKLEKLAGQLKGFRTEVTGTKSFDSAQICCGGADVSQVDPASMESKLHPGLYLTGELLDVDGICGGYNLQWAWSTGILAGRSAAGRKEEIV